MKGVDLNIYNIEEILKSDNIKLEPYRIKQVLKAQEILTFDVLNNLITIENLSFAKLSELYNIDRKAISILAKQIYKIDIDSFKIRSKSFTKILDLPIDEIINLYLNCKKSCRQIGDIYNVEHGVISKLLRDNNITIKSAYDISYYTGENKRQNEPNWLVNDKGYIYKRFRDKQIYQHREVMETYLGRKLKGKEVVHHIDFSTDNNNISNLFVFKSNAQHVRYHSYITQNQYVTPQYYLDNIYIDEKELLTYNFLHNAYVVENKSANEIHKENGISRTLITNKLKEFGIWELKPVQTSKLKQ